VETEIILAPYLALLEPLPRASGKSYYENRTLASSTVTRPISIGSISTSLSRLGLKGPKKLRSAFSPLITDLTTGKATRLEGPDKSDALARSCNGFSAS
jgi:hypothetical protein